MKKTGEGGQGKKPIQTILPRAKMRNIRRRKEKKNT